MDKLDDRENIENSSLKMPKKGEKRDGNYFLAILKVEKSRILKLAEEAEKDLMKLQVDETDSGSEETSGLLRSVIGKARLLTLDKFKQFEGLCAQNMKGDDKILADDLQGFWDMIMIQVAQVDESFKELQKYRENGWKKPVEVRQLLKPQNRRIAKTPLSKLHSSSFKSPQNSAIKPNPELAKRREEQRKKLIEMKKNMKKAYAADNQKNQIVFAAGDDN